MSDGLNHDWPRLPPQFRPTIVYLHLVSQIVGKVPTALLPWRNHGWHLTLRVAPTGLRTETIYGAGDPFELLIDLVAHQVILISDGERQTIPLEIDNVAAFHEAFITMLEKSGRKIAFHDAPNEVSPAIPFAEDREPRFYDPGAAETLLLALKQADRVFRQFRSAFLGKVSPSHFFWGSFDLAITRFSGRAAPPHPGGIPNLPDAVTREAYSHEVSSAGFWPGGAGGEGGPFFYSYAYPSPDGFADAPVEPEAARFDSALGEFILDYADIVEDPDPDALLLRFLQTTYEAAANRAAWDRATLECAIGVPGVPRAV